jgi:hypothetical protein
MIGGNVLLALLSLGARAFYAHLNILISQVLNPRMSKLLITLELYMSIQSLKSPQSE